MKAIGLLQARGRGSTITNKNMYPLNGKPMIGHFLEEMKKADFLDDIGVWTECPKIAKVVEECECHVLHRMKEMTYYGAGFYPPEEWDKCLDKETREKFGHERYIRVWLNCNYVLFSANSLEAMFTKFIEADEAGIIFPVYQIEPDLYIINPETRYHFPVFHRSAADNDLKMYRKVGIHISLSDPLPESTERSEIYHTIPWYEGKDIQELDDISFAEYILGMRGQF